MPLIKSRVPFTPERPYRTVRPTTSKIIFLSCEGSVTEEEYFAHISEVYSGLKSKIQFISVAEDAVHTAPHSRTFDQKKYLSKVRPKQLLERIELFKTEKDEIYQFSEYPDDEFWIITDVDNNWSNTIIDPQKGKTYKDEWDDMVNACQEKGYKFAISNPFFEMWLLLHHDTASEEDKSFAVSDEHPYQKTNHFRNRLTTLGFPLLGKNHKEINYADYSEEKIRRAVQQAEQLHIDKENLCPKYFATTVYLILKNILNMIPENLAD